MVQSLALKIKLREVHQPQNNSGLRAIELQIYCTSTADLLHINFGSIADIAAVASGRIVVLMGR